MINIAGYGLEIIVVALSSFPMGFPLNSFADDTDPLVVEAVEPFGYEMLYDGTLFAFDKAAPVKLSVAVIPGSEEDINLKILLQSKKGNASIFPIPDSTSLLISYPEGKVMLTNGTILSGPLADDVQQSGRKKSNVYTFVFGTFAGAQNGRELVATIAQNVLSIL